MRLTPAEIQHIVATAKDVFGVDVAVWLFGSRVDARQRGGDIDLYIEVPGTLENGLHKETVMNGKLQSKIGEQKIDIVARGSADELKTIHKAALSTGVKLT